MATEWPALLITGGRVVDPAGALDRMADVLIEGGRIRDVATGISAEGRRVLDADGLVVVPGLIDLHAHLRDPGQTHKEDIASGTLAAVRGGFTSIACMANTVPPIDHPTVVEYVRSVAAKSAACRVYPIGAITKGLAGQELALIGGLAAAGVVAISDDGAAVADAGLLRRAMTYAAMYGLPVMEHCEDRALSDAGVMHEGTWSSVLGLHGIPAVAEDTVVARDLLLAESTGAHLHVLHVSTAGSVKLIREAKRRGMRVTAEVTPHHLLLTDEAVAGFDANFKMNPPLRSRGDVAALREALTDGTIDAIATDHAPHTVEEKTVEFDAAPFGVSGLETAVGLMLTFLVRAGGLDLPTLVQLMSTGPATILGLPSGRLAPGAPADLTLLDLDRAWTVDPQTFASKSRNTPFTGWNLIGKAVGTIVGGEIKYSELPVEARS
ncbi:MAG TPA: dihydroorotase [bacterium]|jgi:dihydroorotase